MAGSSSTAAWLCAIRAPGLGGTRLRALLQHFGSIQNLIAAPVAQLRAARVPQSAIDWLQQPDQALLDADAHWLAQPSHHLICCDDADFPALLQGSPRAPAALFVRGDPNWLWHAQIAIVGSRNPTEGGNSNARAFARALARAGFIITSGLADGIDAVAQRAALDIGMPSIAVIATGPDRVYPACNRALADAIAAQGAIVSEYPPGTAPRREHFPQRNRIIAGLALGTLVVEAAQRSGALITAREAAEAGREVFALPGSIHNPLARGCHRLIREGAALVEDAREIIDALAPQATQLAHALRQRLLSDDSPGHDSGPQTTPTAQTHPMPQGPFEDPDYRRLLAALGHDPVAIEILAERTGLGIDALSSMLMLLELEGRVSARHGRYALNPAPS